MMFQATFRWMPHPPLFSGLSHFIAMRPGHVLGDVDVREQYRTMYEGQNGGASGDGDARQDGMYRRLHQD